MTQINPQAPIMVTGATGYLAGVIVKQLLEAGHTVHATVRNPDKVEGLKYLNAIAAGTPGQIKYFKADLMDAASFEAPMAGCELVIHTASPFTLNVKDPQTELVDPAVNGVRNVLNAANATETVKRVVMTSSCAAIYGTNADIEHMPKKMLTEDEWNTSSSLTNEPYAYSKTLAEREGWKIAGEQDRWDLIAINPSFILGPGINPETTGESYAIMMQFGSGAMANGVPNFRIGMVDVREVASAHIKAGFTPEASGRYILSAHDSGFPEMAAALRAHYGDQFKISDKRMPKFVVWLLGPIINPALTRKRVNESVGIDFHADNSKSVRELGIEYRPMANSVVELFQQLIDAGRLIPKNPG
ncbi:NAD-dependent epimerase/dehydratase family protein [Maricaulis sp.]|uniref:NAD-dependent epimerase/dehydratase family protein n=1 Tax=Maricaulis sp. TaxID=1486257 RepID=UPI003A910A7E